jgi:hypothetical protein
LAPLSLAFLDQNIALLVKSYLGFPVGRGGVKVGLHKSLLEGSEGRGTGLADGCLARLEAIETGGGHCPKGKTRMACIIFISREIVYN